MCKSRGPAGSREAGAGMVHAKSNWLNDLTKNCSWYMDDGALLVWLVRGDSHSAQFQIPCSMYVRLLCCATRAELVYRYILRSKYEAFDG
jgi:hypothetical protein